MKVKMIQKMQILNYKLESSSIGKNMKSFKLNLSYYRNRMNNYNKN